MNEKEIKTKQNKKITRNSTVKHAYKKDQHMYNNWSKLPSRANKNLPIKPTLLKKDNELLLFYGL